MMGGLLLPIEAACEFGRAGLDGLPNKQKEESPGQFLHSEHHHSALLPAVIIIMI
jgi:hypothetical protein